MLNVNPILDSWGNPAPYLIRQNILEMLANVTVTDLFIYRNGQDYPEGCEITITTSHDPSRPVKITILGDQFKALQEIILSTLGLNDADVV